jgi:hypothetical protein
MCSFQIAIAGQHVAILTGFTNTQTVGTVLVPIIKFSNPRSASHTPHRGETLENSGEMLGWELRELRLRVTKYNKISKSSQMRNKKI